MCLISKIISGLTKKCNISFNKKEILDIFLKQLEKRYLAITIRFWKIHYRINFWFRRQIGQWNKYLCFVTFMGIISSYISIPYWNPILIEIGLNNYDSYRTALQVLGGGLISATTISFALVMFTMQINVDKMPYGLFRKFGSDIKLFGAYLISFLLAIFVILLSLAPEHLIIMAGLTSFWMTIVIFLLFLFAYKRALLLINPAFQLKLLAKKEKNILQNWGKIAERIFPSSKDQSDKQDNCQVEYDLERLKFFQTNVRWTESLKLAIRYTISYSRRYAKVNDHEVSSIALGTLVDFNISYIQVKGKTFISGSSFMENPLSTDDIFINTLEHLRENIQIGLLQKDEQLIKLTLKTISRLISLYIKIQYSEKYANKIDAHLAVSYLKAEIESVVSHKMIDVLMYGVKLLRDNAAEIMYVEDPDKIILIIETISKLAVHGISSREFYPLTESCIEALSDLTIYLLTSPKNNTQNAFIKIRESITALVGFSMLIKEPSFSQNHHNLFSKYYTIFTHNSLHYLITELANNIITNENINADEIKSTIGNFCLWADRLYQSEREVFQTVMKHKSSLTFDIINWIADVTEILLAIAGSEGCDNHESVQLQKHALWLISSFSFIPDDQEAIDLLEKYNMTEVIFESAYKVLDRNYKDIANDIRKILIDWVFKAAKYECNHQPLGYGMLGATCLAIRFGDQDELIEDITKGLIDGSILINNETRLYAVKYLREFIASPQTESRYSLIAKYALKSDLSVLLEVLNRLVDVFDFLEDQ